jgi:hypothetical protein
VLANAERLTANNPKDTTPQELANLFCKNARKRISENFRAVNDNHNGTYNHIADRFMQGKLRWLCTDIFGELPPKYRDYAEKGQKATSPEDMVAAE